MENHAGYIVILALLVLAGLLVLGLFLLDHFLFQVQINANLYAEMKTYYLARAGIEYAIYRLDANPAWRTRGFTQDLGGAGKIKVVISNGDPDILIESYGIYRKYEMCQVAYYKAQGSIVAENEFLPKKWIK